MYVTFSCDSTCWHKAAAAVKVMKVKRGRAPEMEWLEPSRFSRVFVQPGKREVDPSGAMHGK
jgi:hypothetical protein